ncbi:MAG: DUF1700 domain-containing protein [Acholeplasmataceae bacterium]|nr:DUF1700 domain-containing protein [Acholeplasmataceae bacterium]
MKAKYLNSLRTQLEEFQASKAEINEIVNDYDQLYDDALSTGKTDDEVWNILGDPKSAAYELIDTLKLKKEKSIRNKIIALTPFVSLIIFFVMGLYYDLWHLGWMVFLMIPVTSIILHTRLKDGIIALSPFVSVIAYLILGWGFDLWHPGWLIFLLIPMVSILLHTRLKDVFVAIAPFVSVIVFILLGTYYNLWNPGWLVFLSIPMLGILLNEKLWKVLLYEASFIAAILFYLYMGYTYGYWNYGALGFALPLIVGIIFGDIHILWDNQLEGHYRQKALMMVSVVFISISIFLALGIALNGWAYAWQVFLFIPMVAIITFDKVRFTALIPFIAVILFFSLGYFFGLFYISWLAFLLIPIVAIIENA